MYCFQCCCPTNWARAMGLVPCWSSFKGLSLTFFLFTYCLRQYNCLSNSFGFFLPLLDYIQKSLQHIFSFRRLWRRWLETFYAPRYSVRVLWMTTFYIGLFNSKSANKNMFQQLVTGAAKMPQIETPLRDLTRTLLPFINNGALKESLKGSKWQWEFQRLTLLITSEIVSFIMSLRERFVFHRKYKQQRRRKAQQIIRLIKSPIGQTTPNTDHWLACHD